MGAEGKQWVWRTSLGWFVGFVLVLALSVPGEATALPDTQAMVGVGMGLGVGLVQAPVAKRWFGANFLWVLASVLGLTEPFVVGELLGLVFDQLPSWLLILLAVLTGGLLIGLLQMKSLAKSPRAKWWPVFSALGWGLAAGVVGLADLASSIGMSAIGDWGALAVLIVLLAGGPVLGLVTGRALVWTLRD